MTESNFVISTGYLKGLVMSMFQGKIEKTVVVVADAAFVVFEGHVQLTAGWQPQHRKITAQELCPPFIVSKPIFLEPVPGQGGDYLVPEFLER